MLFSETTTTTLQQHSPLRGLHSRAHYTPSLLLILLLLTPLPAHAETEALREHRANHPGHMTAKVYMKRRAVCRVAHCLLGGVYYRGEGVAREKLEERRCEDAAEQYTDWYPECK